jgi:hypothetical protein
MKQIIFNDADKFVVHHDYLDRAWFAPIDDIRTEYGLFLRGGEFLIKRGFLFSANFPAINTFNTRRSACVHDFFYSLMKDGWLGRNYRQQVDELFYDHLREDGMNPLRAYYWFQAVRVGGEAALNKPRPMPMSSPQPPKTQEPHKFGMA